MRKNEKRIRPKTKFHNSRKSYPYCKYHKVNTHDTRECRAIKGKQANTATGNEINKTPKSYALKETQPRVHALEAAGYIRQTPVDFIIDTGSAYSYIDSNVVQDNDLTPYPVEELECINVNSNLMTTNREVEFPLTIQGDACNDYKVVARVVEQMSSQLILGIDFLTCQEAIIDFKRNIISLDNKEYEISVLAKNRHHLISLK
ncbi:hypothetical protein EQH57_0382 [Dictyocoela roeselum]|nr:hypothetical protein EQH57_0382 [Dictyocoela roeselum]